MLSKLLLVADRPTPVQPEERRKGNVHVRPISAVQLEAYRIRNRRRSGRCGTSHDVLTARKDTEWQCSSTVPKRMTLRPLLSVHGCAQSRSALLRLPDASVPVSPHDGGRKSAPEGQTEHGAPLLSHLLLDRDSRGARWSYSGCGVGRYCDPQWQRDAETASLITPRSDCLHSWSRRRLSEMVRSSGERMTSVYSMHFIYASDEAVIHQQMGRCPSGLVHLIVRINCRPPLTLSQFYS